MKVVAFCLVCFLFQRRFQRRIAFSGINIRCVVSTAVRNPTAARSKTLNLICIRNRGKLSWLLV